MKSHPIHIDNKKALFFLRMGMDTKDVGKEMGVSVEGIRRRLPDFPYRERDSWKRRGGEVCWTKVELQDALQEIADGKDILTVSKDTGIASWALKECHSFDPFIDGVVCWRWKYANLRKWVMDGHACVDIANALNTTQCAISKLMSTGRLKEHQIEILMNLTHLSRDEILEERAVDL